MKRMILAALVGLSGMAFAATERNLNVVDLLVAFDQSAQRWLAENGHGSVEDFAQEQVDRANLCLANSGLTDAFTFRLAGTMVSELDTGALSVPEILINGLQFSAMATGEWRKVWQKRDEVGADLFSFVTGGDDGSGIAGLGYTLATGAGIVASESDGLAAQTADWIRLASDMFCFNVTVVQALAREGDYTFAHEFAHNMGCGHSDAEADKSRFYDFSLGMQFGDYVTVMGYADASHRTAPVFSSPAVTYEGLTTGDADHDNVRTLRDNYKSVAKYRVSKSAPLVEPDPVDPPVVDPPVVEPDPVDPQPQPDTPAEPTVEPVLDFTPTGTFAPAAAINGLAPYCGAVYTAAGEVRGVIQLKIGKENAGKRVSKVSGAITLQTGKKYSLKAADFATGNGLGVREDVVVKGLGTLSLAIGADGFSGSIATPEGTLLVKTAALAGGLAAETALFRMDDVPEVGGFPVLDQCLPNGAEVVSSNGRWQFAKAAKVKYAKVKGSSPVAWELVIDEGRDGLAVNRSGLKLTYAAKTGTFKGGFTLYADVGTEAKPKLKKYKATVTGVVVDGVGYGQAVLKNPAMSWPIEVR